MHIYYQWVGATGGGKGGARLTEGAEEANAVAVDDEEEHQVV